MEWRGQKEKEIERNKSGRDATERGAKERRMKLKTEETVGGKCKS